MLQRILVATDGSDGSVDAARLLAALPLPAGTEILVVSVMDALLERLLEQARPGEKHAMRRAVHNTRELLEREGLTIRCDLRTGDAAHEVLAAAKEFGAELIVMGGNGVTGLQGALLGSVARNVAKHARCSVLIARAPRHGLSHVVVATDGSEHAGLALNLAAKLPLPGDPHFTLVHVLRPQTPMLGMDFTGMADETLVEMLQQSEKAQREQAEKLLATQLPLLQQRTAHARPQLRTGDPAWEILAAAAETDADLIIAGARGVSLIEGLLTGSVADRLLGKAECSILLAR